LVLAQLCFFWGFSDDVASMPKHVGIVYFVCFLVVLCEFVIVIIW